MSIEILSRAHWVLAAFTLAASLVVGAMLSCEESEAPPPTAVPGVYGITIDEHGYHPYLIRATVGKPLTLKIKRRTKLDCFNEFILDKMDLRRKLPYNEVVTIVFTPDRAGQFDFHCQMHMAHGTIIVEEREN